MGTVLMDYGNGFDGLREHLALQTLASRGFAIFIEYL